MLDAQDLQAIGQLLDAKIDAKLAENNKVLLDQFNAVIESAIVPQIKAVADGHKLLLERLPNADTVHALEQRVDILEFTVKTLVDKARA